MRHDSSFADYFCRECFHISPEAEVVAAKPGEETVRCPNCGHTGVVTTETLPDGEGGSNFYWAIGEDKPR